MRSCVLGLALGLAGCSVPKEINPVWIYDQVSGRADRARPPLPGLDQPYPNLASVPPRPEKPPLQMREQLSASLAEDRSRSREPLAPRTAAGPPVFRPAPGEPPLPGAPPPPAALAGAQPIPWDEPTPLGTAAPQPVTPTPTTPAATPAQPVAPAAPVPTAPPAAPPPDLLGPPALPSPDLLAPAPPRR